MFVIANWSDEELKPIFAQLLALQIPANTFDGNGYSALCGIESPIELYAAKVGKKAQEAELARIDNLQKFMSCKNPI